MCALCRAFLIGVLVVYCGAAFGQTAEVIRTIPAPGGPRYEVGGLAWDGVNLWAVTDNPDEIHNVDPADGTVLSSCWTPREGCHGLTWALGELWTGSGSAHVLSVLDPQSDPDAECFELRWFPSPFANNPSGFAWDGLYIWACDNLNGVICEIDPGDGTVIRCLESGRYLHDLAWDGRYVWASAMRDNQLIAFDPASLDVICEVPIPSPMPPWTLTGGGPSGLAWDGTYFWCSTVGGGTIYQLALSCAVLVDIDIKPGSDPNCFNLNGHGVVPVAILSSPGFDATEVDPVSVRLLGFQVKVAGKNARYLAHIEDSNGDGLDDLVVQIEDQDGDFSPGEAMATLTGNLYDGTPIEGTDSICIVP